MASAVRAHGSYGSFGFSGSCEPIPIGHYVQKSSILPTSGKSSDGSKSCQNGLTAKKVGVELVVNNQDIPSFITSNADLICRSEATRRKADYALAPHLLGAVTSLKQEIAALKAQSCAIKRENASLQVQNRDLLSQNRDLQAQIDALQVENRNFKRYISHLVATLTRGKSDYERLSHAHTALAHENASLHKHIGELKQQLGECAPPPKKRRQGKADNPAAQLAREALKVSEQAAQIECLTGELEIAKRDINSLQYRVTMLIAENDRLHEKDLQRNCPSLVVNSDKRRAVLYSNTPLCAEGQRSETTREISEGDRETSEADYRERQTLISKVAILTNELALQKAQCQQLSGNNEYLASTIATVMAECIDLTQKLASSYEENANLNELVTPLREKIAALLKSSPPHKLPKSSSRSVLSRKPSSRSVLSRKSPKADFILVEEHKAALQQSEERTCRVEAEKYRMQVELLRVYSHAVELTGRETSLRGTISLLESKLISSQATTLQPSL